MNMLTAFDGSVLQMEIAWMCAAVVHIKRKLAQAFTPNKPWLSDLNLTVYFHVTERVSVRSTHSHLQRLI